MRTHSLIYPVALIAAILFYGSAPSAQKVRRTVMDVTSALADVGPTTGHPLLVQSDRKGPYVTTVVGKTTQVQSVLINTQYGTDWSLTTYYTVKNRYAASDRTVYLDLTEQVNSGGFVTPILGVDENGGSVERGYVASHLTTRCAVANISMLAMATLTTVQCPGALRFQSPDGQWYRLSFQPDNFPQSERFNVTCTRGDSTGCREWQITPSGTTLTGTDPNPKNLNTLLMIDDGGDLAQGGDYHLSFAFTVTR